MGDADIVVEDVDAAEMPDGRGDAGLDRGEVGDIGGEGESLAALAGDDRGGLFSGIAVEVDAGDAGALASISDENAALPLPQPGPEEPAPKTMAILPFSRSAMWCSFDEGREGRGISSPVRRGFPAPYGRVRRPMMRVAVDQLSELPTAFSRIAQASSPYFFFHSA